MLAGRRPRAVIALLLGLLATLGASRIVAQVQEPPRAPGQPAESAPSAPAMQPPAAATVPTQPDVAATGIGERPVEKPPPLRALEAPDSPATATRAWQVIEKHCAHCHQVGRLKRPAAAAGFGNILRFDEIASDPALVLPGNPDGSRLYTHMLRRLMPFDIYQEGATGDEPAADDLTAIRNWIAGLSPPSRTCNGRQPVTKEQVAAALGRFAEAAGPAVTVASYRFISLAHLYNACASDEAMFVWRQAVVRLFNSLSWRPVPIRVEPVDEARTVYKVDLTDLGWVAAHWDRIVQSAPNAGGNFVSLPQTVTATFGTVTPVVRGDWFAKVTMQAPLYYDLLGLPENGPEITKLLQIDVDTLRRAGAVQRTPVKASQVMRAGRAIERTSSSRSSLWQVYDGQRDAPDAAPNIVPPHEASLGMFTLPNGFPAFYALSQRGSRLDRSHAEIARKSMTPRSGLRAGLYCLACHSNGPQLRPETGGPLSALAVADRTAVESAQRRVQLATDYASDLGEPVSALARQYVRPIGFDRLRAELGVSADALAALARDPSSGVAGLVKRAMQGTVSRAEIEAEWQVLLGALRLAPAADAQRPAFVPVDEAADPGLALQLLSDKMTYKSGDALALTIKSSADCYLTVVSVDTRGRGTVIFPSDFEQNNLLPAGRAMRLPGDGAPYVFRLREKGREAIVAKCSPSGGAVDGISHDFERQRFTDLGDYATFLAQAAAAEQEARRNKTQVQPAPEPKRRGRRGRDRAEQGDQRPRPEQVSRTAITITVE